MEAILILYPASMMVLLTAIFHNLKGSENSARQVR